MDETHPQRRQQLGEADRLALGGDRAARLVAHAVLRPLLDQWHHHEDSMPGACLVAHPLPRPVEVCRGADPGPDRDAALGWCPQVRHVEIRVEQLAERPRDRRRGHQQDVGRLPARLRLELMALLHAEAVLLVDDDQTEIGELDRLLDQGVCPDHDPRLPRADLLERVPPAVRREGPGQQRHRYADPVEQPGDRPEMLAGKQVRRSEQRALAPRLRRSGERPGGDRGLARPDVPLEQAEHRCVAGQVSPQRVDRGSLVRRQVQGPADLRGECLDDRGPDRRIGLVGHLDPWRRVPRPLAAPPDHPDLQREELIEGESPEGGIPCLERRRVVGLLEGDADRSESFGLNDRGRQVLRVLVACAIERLADRRSQSGGCQTRRQRVDGHDPPGVEHLGVALGDLELGVVEGELAAEPLDLAGHDDRVARLQPALDVASPEPCGLGCAGLIGQRGDGPLDPSPERGFDVDVGDAHARRRDGSLLDPRQVSESLHLAQVVVPAGQVEEEVPDVVPAEPGPSPPERCLRGQPGLAQRRLQQPRRVARDNSRDGSAGHAYSAEMR